MNTAVATAPTITAGDRLGLTLFFAVAIHGIIILGITFRPEDKANIPPPPSLDIIMVQNHNSLTPEKADYLSQFDQSGGGISDDRERPSSPFSSPELTNNDGIAPQPLEVSKPNITEPTPQEVLTQLYSEEEVNKNKLEEISESPNPKKEEKFDYELEIAKLTTELNVAMEAYAKRPRKISLTANTQAYVPAQYMHSWVEKVERIGNLNYPDEAMRKKVNGTLLLEVELKWDGSIIEINLLRSSGHKILDDAAKRIVELAGPFPPFPSNLRDLTDHVEIVRTWQFEQGDLQTR